MSRYKTITFTSASVTAQSSLDINTTGFPNFANLVRVKVTPNTAGGSARVQIYGKDTFVSADLMYNVDAFSGALVDPRERGTSLERNQYPVCFYEDRDSTGELHMRIYNDDTAAKTYAVEIDIEEIVYVKTKAADENVTNSTTTQNDDHLVLNLQAARKYRFRAVFLHTTASANAGFKFDFNQSTCTVTTFRSWTVFTGTTTVAGQSTLAGASGANSTGSQCTIVEGYIDVNAAGTFGVKWAQNTVDAGNAVTLQIGSYIEIVPII